MSINKKKIINDPVYGFVNLPFNIIFDIIEHPYFQRLRRIKQLGLTHLVYPGAFHTRFHHAIGATHLMSLAIKNIRSKGHQITKEEELAVTIAILLHDIGHGPFSHVLEHDIVNKVNHEELSSIFMNRLNEHFKGKLSLAIAIFNNQYPKKFLHQLVSSQLDVDRLDYLKRDSFFTGVSEGVIGSDRIIKMLNVVDDNLVVEAKGIYSIENFLVSRRLMYWQVYLHKTVVSAEQLLVKILKRAKELAGKDIELFASPTFKYFLYNKIDKSAFLNSNNDDDNVALNQFAKLDDYDIMISIKVWAEHSDKTLSTLCRNLISRNLYKIELQKKPFDKSYINQIAEKTKAKYKLTDKEISYFVFTNSISNNAYNIADDKINILYNTGEVIDIKEASDTLNVSALSQTVMKYFLCYPKEIAEL